MHPTTSVTLGQIIQTSVSSLSPRPTPLSSPGSRKHDGVSSVSPTPTLLSSPGSRKDDGESSVSPTPNLLPSPGSRNDDSMSMVAMAVLYAVIGLAVILIVLVVIWFYMQRRGLRRGLREELPDGGQAMTQEQKGPGPGPDPVVPGYCELATSEVTPIELEAIVAYELDSSTQPEHMNGTGLQNIPRESNPRPRQTNGSLEFELPGTVPGMLPNAFSRST
ncbi:hypothetical protein QQS21_009686 [Conoideocrella luteorostrata]|uniref:Uncharacterized protein n=1 Tax=Conoideocrella luteorostrata TaxID=1105319 RepID=A0AAJ0CGJ9_9HYPO|nr:hypothetical protein QQS21_009686 [Conoideocrella luteorostrata]